jgi:hypothetical protein
MTPELLVEVPSKKKVHYLDNNKIVLQRIRDGDIRDGQSTSIPDQGIRFDKDGNPWDKNNKTSHQGKREDDPPGGSKEPAQSHAGRNGPPDGDGSGDDGDGSGNDLLYNTSSNDSTNHSSPDEEENSRMPLSRHRRDSRARHSSR